MYCTECGMKIRDNIKFCTACGRPLSNSTRSMTSEGSIIGLKQSVTESRGTLVSKHETNNIVRNTAPDYQKEILKVQNKQLEIQKKQSDAMARCPRCGSTSLSGNKKGFGIGKAVIGGAIAGPIGLVAGNLGAKKVQVTCLKCGKKFNA